MDKIRKDWAVMIALAAVSLLVVLNFSAILTWISEFIGMMFPLILGMILAFVLNVPMKRIEQVLEKINFPQKLRRSVAILSIIVILLLIISLLIWIIAPMIAKTVSQLGDSVNHLLFVVADFVQHSKLMQSSEVSQITDSLSQSNIVSSVITFLGGFTTNISGLFSNVFSVIMGIFFMINILASKEMLAHLTLRILNVVLPKDKIEHITYVGEVIVDTYDRFLMSQIIEAGIVGVMIFAGYSLVGLPYAGLVGVLAGVFSFIPNIGPFMACGIVMLFIFTESPIQALISVVVFMVVQTVEGNVVYPRVVGSSVGLPYAGLVGVLSGVLSFIPYIGPFMACGIGMLFTFTESPIQALISLVVFMIVQIVEGNVVYPKVVGSSVGLPTILTLAAALIGGNLFGLVGMIFFIPIFAVIYRFVKEWVEKHEQAASVVAVGGIIDEEN